jgi:hypothetical protein
MEKRKMGIFGDEWFKNRYVIKAEKPKSKKNRKIFIAIFS